MDGLGINFSDVGMCRFAIANLPLWSQIQVEFLPPCLLKPLDHKAAMLPRLVIGYVCTLTLRFVGTLFGPAEQLDNIAQGTSVCSPRNFLSDVESP